MVNKDYHKMGRNEREKAVLEKKSQREISLSLRSVWCFWMTPCLRHN